MKKKYGIICLVMTMVLVLLVVNTVSQTKNLRLSDDFLDSILSGNIHNKETLIKNGFEEIQDNSYVFHYDNEDALCSIVVTFDDAAPSHAKQYKSLSYDAKESRMGILDPQRLYSKESLVTRRCLIYMDGVTINISEDNTENSPFAFQEYFLNEFGKNELSAGTNNL